MDLRCKMILSDSCSKCGKESFTFQKSSGRYLCKECYISYFERKFQKTVSKFNIINSGDVVCVGLSGGKDSITLLYNLYLRQKHINSPKIIAISVDEGISDTFIQNQKQIQKFFVDFNIKIPFFQASYKEIFGLTMDEIVKIIHDKKLKMNACTVCASIRRRIINDIANENNATNIAIGHNLDDVAQSILMNVLRNDIEKIKNSVPYSSSKDINSPFLTRIKPLFLFSEEEIIQYCEAKKLPYYSKTCDNALKFPILRKKVQIFLNKLDERSFEFKYNMIKFHLGLNEKINENTLSNINDNSCSSCSFPAGPNRDICTYCEFKQTFLHF